MTTATVGALRVVLGLNSAAFTEGLTAAQKHLRGVGQSMQRVGATIATVGAGMTAAMTAPLIALGVQMGRAAIEAEEMQSAFSVSFGAMATDMRTWAEATGDAMSRSTFELQEMALGFNGLFKAGGPVTKQAADMSQQFTVLAQDLSSFHNIAQQDVFAALRSGLSGEAEPLRRFNVYLTEAAVKAEAMRLGLSSTGGTLSELAKIQARASLIMKGTAEAQGDVIRTSAGTQNQLRALQSQWAELSVTLGQKILPLLTPIVSALNNIAKAFSNLSPAMQNFVLVAGAIGAAIGPVLIIIGAVVAALGTLATSFAAGGALAGAGAAIGAIVPFILPVAAAVAGVAAAFMLFRDDVEPVLKRLWAEVQKTLGPALADLLSTVSGLVSGLAGAWMEFFDGPAGQVISKFAALVVDLLGTSVVRTLTALVVVVEGTLSNIGSLFSILGDLLTGDFAGAWATLKGAVTNTLEMLGGVIDAFWPGAVDSMRKLYEGVKTWLQDRLGAVFDWVGRKVKETGDFFYDLYDRVVGNSYVPDMVTEVGQWMARLDQMMVVPAQTAARKTAEAFEQARDRARAAVQQLLTDEERGYIDHQEQVRSLQGGIAQGGPDADLFRRMLERENAGWDGRNLRMPEVPDLKDLGSPGIDALNDSMERVNQHIRDSREKFADAFEYGIESALRGDWDGVLQAIVGDAFRNGLREIGRNLFNSLGGGRDGINWGQVFAALPGFKTGGSFKVGGPTASPDSAVVAFRATPGEMVDIRRPGQDMGGGVAHVMVEFNDPMFRARVRKETAPMVVQAGAASAQYSQAKTTSDLSRRQAYSARG